MKYILILLLFSGLGVKGQMKEIYYSKFTDSEKISAPCAILTGLYYGDDPHRDRGKLLMWMPDTCQKYRDSVIRYAANIKMWQRRISPLNPAGYNMLINKEIAGLEAIRKKYRKLANKCK